MGKLVFYKLLLIIALTTVSCSHNFYISESKYKNNHVELELAKGDNNIINLYNPYKEVLDSSMSRVIGYSDEALVKNKPESGLTNFLADLLLEEASQFLSKEGEGGCISFFNYGGIRTFIPGGDVTVGNIFELMPFENEMIFLRLKGATLKLFFDKIASEGGGSLGGVRFVISGGKAKNIFVGKELFNIEKEYWLATNDYIAGGGDSMEMLKDAVQVKKNGKLLRDIIINHIEGLNAKGKKIPAITDGRIKYE